MPVDEAGGPAAAGRPQPAELGDLLVAAREAAGLSLEDVASRTRIRVSLIRSMEAGDFAPCGGAVYARGHLRSIAHVVGADDKGLVSTYDRMAGASPPAAAGLLQQPAAGRPVPVPFATLASSSRSPVPVPDTVRTPPPVRAPVSETVQVTGQQETPATRLPARSGGPPLVLKNPRPERDRRGSPLLLAAIGVAALVIVVAVIALARPHHGGTAHLATSRPTPSVTSSAPTATPPSPTAPQTLADAGVNVVVSVSASPSWVHVVDATGALVYQGIVGPGTTKSFHSAQQLKFVFGYAPAVQLTVNGHAIGSPPASGSSDVANEVFDAQSGA